MKIRLITLFITTITSLSLNAGINSTMNAFGLKDSDGTITPADTFFLVAISTEDANFTNTFSTGFDPSMLSPGDILEGSTDDTVIKVDVITEFLGEIKANGTVPGLGYDGFDEGAFPGVGEDDPIAIYWFPGLVSGNSVATLGDTFGILSVNSGTPQSIVQVNDEEWILPPNGFNPTYEYRSTENGGPGPDAIANNAFIPEPSMAPAILGLSALLLSRRRR